MDAAIPRELWQKLGRTPRMVDVRLRGGKILPNLLVGVDGHVEGLVVGGQTGVVEDIDLDPEKIEAIRPVTSGLWSRLGLVRWVTR